MGRSVGAGIAWGGGGRGWRAENERPGLRLELDRRGDLTAARRYGAEDLVLALQPIVVESRTLTDRRYRSARHTSEVRPVTTPAPSPTEPLVAVRVFLFSTGDLLPERAVVKRVIDELNALPQHRDRLKLIPFAYEDALPP